MAKRIKIINESPSLGDLLAWVPVANSFQEQTGYVVDFFTPNRHIFPDPYGSMNLFAYNHNSAERYDKEYHLGFKLNPSVNKRSDGLKNLQEIASDILGIEYVGKRPILEVKNAQRKLLFPYVCISTSSTSKCKLWNNEEGWAEIISFLNEIGYHVVVIQSEPFGTKVKTGSKVIHPKTESIDEAISWLLFCDFSIGLGSGISWLSWSLLKPVVLISGFSLPFSEFHTPYRVINTSVCHGCWNDPSETINKNDWLWCPRKKDFECSKAITPEMVKEKIKMCIEDIKKDF
jgi:autotransporter strand-loop-strand O-heptosyltransferase